MKESQREIRELKQSLLRANKDIEKLSKVKSDFVSIISHELRTPLTSIKESVSLVLEGVTGPLNEEQRKFLSITKTNIDRLVKIITDILDFSKLESGRITMHRRKENINRLIEGVYGRVKDVAGKKGLAFSLDLSGELEPTWLDLDRITQVLNNLVSNAIKFNKEKGEIKISSTKEIVGDSESIKIIVEDTGAGISKENLPKLFKEFNPLDASMTRSYGGVGLGLAISKSIVRLHGGSIWVESEKGLGSRFIFTLPVYKRNNEFNFLLDWAIERAKYNDLKLTLIIFGLKNPKDANENTLAELEKTIQSAVRGPEDKVVRFDDKDLIAVMAGTDLEGAEKILKRLKKKVKAPLNFGIGTYPDKTQVKGELIKGIEKELKDKKNIL
ncbi:MAG: ATP-binding protein [Candidatus Gorgyraea atricola]|nr:ATP-binding protein [Candidatus Gorgyraea atricola]